MRKTKEDVNLIHIFIKNHIKSIKEGKKSKLDLEVDYTLLKEAVDTIILEYINTKGDPRRHKDLEPIIIDTYTQIQDYLRETNPYDHKLLELYVALDKYADKILFN